MHRILPALLSSSLAVLFAGCCDEKNVPAFTRNLSSGSASDRNEAALNLARCGERAGHAVPRLSAMLYDDNPGVQSSAAYALRRIDTADARRALERAEAARRKDKSRRSAR